LSSVLEKSLKHKFFSLVKLYLYHHFTQQPLSALFEAEQPLDQTAWKPAFFTRLRGMLIHNFDGEKGEMHIKLPFPGSTTNERSKQEHFQELLQNDNCLANCIANFVTDISRERVSILTGVRLAHLLRVELRISNGEGHQHLIFEPRKSTFGGLLCALLNQQQATTAIQEIRTALRSKSLSEIETILDQIRAGNIIQGTDQEKAFKSMCDRLANTTSATEGENDRIQIEKEALMNGNDEEAGKEARRLALVQKNLLREESNSTLRRDICDEIVAILRNLLSTSSALSQLWRYNSTGYLYSILEPSPRINYLAALKNPSGYLKRTSDALEMPDVCRAYQTYEDAGRLINLADWFNAFYSSINDSEKEEISNNDARKRKRLDDEGQNELESYKKDLANWEKKDVVRLRFALAVHEMGKMGFLKRTRRKLEHVLKLVYDLPLKE
jgi:Origin recognition complex winged helix C-terminal